MIGVTDRQALMMAQNLGFDGPKEKQVRSVLCDGIFFLVKERLFNRVFFPSGHSCFSVCFG